LGGLCRDDKYRAGEADSRGASEHARRSCARAVFALAANQGKSLTFLRDVRLSAGAEIAEHRRFV